MNSSNRLSIGTHIRCADKLCHRELLLDTRSNLFANPDTNTRFHRVQADCRNLSSSSGFLVQCSTASSCRTRLPVGAVVDLNCAG